MYGVGQTSRRRRGSIIVAGAIVLGLTLAGLFYAFYALVLNENSETPTPTPEATATIQVASSSSTATPMRTSTATLVPVISTATRTKSPTDTPKPTATLRPPPEAITISVRARINITEGLLNLRELPTLSGSTVITQLVPGAEVDVIGGPEDVGDLRWWNVNGGEGRVGWVVEAFGGETYLAPLGWIEQLSPLVTPTPTHTATPTPTPVSATPTTAVTPTLTSTTAPAVTLTLTPTVTPEITATAAPVLTPTTTPEGGVPSPTVGGQAEVTTRFQFINLRAGPGLDAEVIGQLQDGTIVTILDGPEEADDFRWWQVEDNEGNAGWAAERVGDEVLLAPIP